MVLGLHSYPHDQVTLADRCENRIVHHVGEADANVVSRLLLARPPTDSGLYRVEEELLRLGVGRAFVSFVDEQGDRLPPLMVQVAEEEN
jgi:hypothetical protein